MTNQSVIITGSSHGLGLSLAERFAAKGFRVVGVHRGRAPDARWSQLVAKGQALEVVGTVASEDTVESAVTAAQKLGTVKAVVNCAGVGVFGEASAYTKSDIDTVLEANLIGTILFSGRAFSLFRAEGGAIVNVMSTAALVGRVNEAVYCAAKWGTRGYTEALRLEAKGTPVRIISVFPGGMRTPFWSIQKGASVDSTSFMPPEDVADVLMDAILDRKSLYVSDIAINRT